MVSDDPADSGRLRTVSRSPCCRFTTVLQVDDVVLPGEQVPRPLEKFSLRDSQTPE
jgi:hypothetical protein